MAPYPSIIKLAELNGQNGFRVQGVPRFERLGTEVAGIGDLNGDGISDFIVGALAPFDDMFDKSYVVFGRAGGFPATFDIANLDGRNGFAIVGALAGDNAGTSAAAAGDVNGDGLDDLIIGAPGGFSTRGAAYVVYGREGGFDAAVDLGDVDGVTISRFDGYLRAGSNVAGGGDVNGDGIDDIIIAAAGQTFSSSPAAVYVVFGRPGGFGASFNLAALNGTNGFRIDPVQPDDSFGREVTIAGDINGDGIDDLMIGAPVAGSGTPSVYVVFGRSSPFGPTFNLNQLDGTNGFRLDGPNLSLTGDALSIPGDINGDGYDDLLIGAPRNGSSLGSAYVVFGSAAGFNAVVDVEQLNGRNGFRIDGVASNDAVGRSLAAGDVNADGIDDLVIGLSHPGQPAYVMFGHGGDWAPVIPITSIQGSRGYRLDGPAGPVVSTGDVNGDGITDVMVGSAISQSAFFVYGSLPGEAVVRWGTAIGQTIQGGAFSDELYGAEGNDTLLGHGGNDTMSGGRGDDSVAGGAGADVLDGGDGADRVEGGEEDDLLRGRAGNDTLDGGAGADRMEGSSGNDTYRVDSSADVIVELARHGNDSVESTVSFVLPDHVENLTLLGDANRDGTGNAGRNRITGNSGDNTLLGGGGPDTLIGGAGNDRLDGGDGADSLVGGRGDDVYTGVVLSGPLADTITENAGGGIDTVQSEVSLSLGGVGEVERLVLKGEADIDGTGNALGNFISGNTGANALNGGAGDDSLKGGTGEDTLSGGAGADVVNGGKGNDLLSGGAGADLFLFVSPETHNDRITDFAAAEDRFDLAGRAFGARTEAGGDTTLSYDGGTIVVAGVTGLSLAEWNALVVDEGGGEALWAEPLMLSSAAEFMLA